MMRLTASGTGGRNQGGMIRSMLDVEHQGGTHFKEDNMKIIISLLPFVFMVGAIIKGSISNDGPTVTHLLLICISIQLLVISLGILYQIGGKDQ